MRSGIFEAPTALSGVRTYSPGFRPSIAFNGLGTTSPTSMGGAVPGWAVALGIGGIALFAIGAIVVNPIIGYYVGKKLGTKWGWFWGGFGGPVGLAAMQGYRQYKGRVHSDDMKSNRRRRRRHHRRSRRCFRRNCGE